MRYRHEFKNKMIKPRGLIERRKISFYRYKGCDDIAKEIKKLSLIKKYCIHKKEKELKCRKCGNIAELHWHFT